MSAVITVTNNKGGVGKTTTVVNLGAALSRRGHKVLLIDYDGQANLSTALGVKPTDGRDSFHAVQRQPLERVQPYRVADNDREVLDVLPGTRDLQALTHDFAARLRKLVELYREYYDSIIIDTTTALGPLTISAISAADELIIPCLPQKLSICGLLELRATVDQLTGGRFADVPAEVLFTQYDRRKRLHRQVVEAVENSGFKVFDTKIRDNVDIGEAQAANVDIFSYNPKSNGAADYEALADEWSKHGRQRPKKGNKA